mmetsp:Transcript_14712/g.41840  ORF Transcript_14712/g.41840 Transcript_14712/m.41840 type:complete len:295 (-) Transcript_14712:360-1244(-)
MRAELHSELRRLAHDRRGQAVATGLHIGERRLQGSLSDGVGKMGKANGQNTIRRGGRVILESAAVNVVVRRSQFHFVRTSIDHGGQFLPQNGFCSAPILALRQDLERDRNFHDHLGRVLVVKHGVLRARDLIVGLDQGHPENGHLQLLGDFSAPQYFYAVYHRRLRHKRRLCAAVAVRGRHVYLHRLGHHRIREPGVILLELDFSAVLCGQDRGEHHHVLADYSVLGARPLQIYKRNLHVDLLTLNNLPTVHDPQHRRSRSEGCERRLGRAVFQVLAVDRNAIAIRINHLRRKL